MDSKIIAIENSEDGKIVLVLEEQELSKAALNNVFKGQSLEDQTDFTNRRFTPFFQNGLGESLIGKTFKRETINGITAESYY